MPPSDDPARPGGMPPPDDPARPGGMPPPDDPARPGGMPPPDDPARPGGMPPPDDPARPGGMPPPDDPQSCPPGPEGPLPPGVCGGPPSRTRRGKERGRRQGAELSGFVIVRLVPEVSRPGADSLEELARERGLEGLLRVLERAQAKSSRRLVRCDPKRLADLEQRARHSDLPPLRSLSQYWRVDLRHRPRALRKLLRRLNRLPEVDLAYAELEASDPAVDPTDDPHAASQGYLDAAPVGIDARWAWTQTDGEGAGLELIDLEQGWYQGHEDFASKSPSLVFGDNRDGAGAYKGDHGSAVLGVAIADDNALGVVGIATSVSAVRLASHYDAATDTNGHVAEAIVAAALELDPGDVLLLEVQRSFLPTEIDDADFDAIRLAVAHGVIVIEAAGNGSSDLDAYTDAVGDAIFDRSDPTYRESGAIVVGAALAPLPHDRKAASNYGSRVDCYAWGEQVTSCGYGDLAAGSGDNQTYTADFQNTSAASPIVAGAALVVQGKYRAVTATSLSPLQMRALLSDPVLNTAQGGGVGGSIGVMPDLHAILSTSLGLVPDVYLRDNLGDSGVVPTTGGISASPDIIVRPSQEPDPQAAFGEGSGTEGSNTLGFEVEAGQDNFVYVRMKNRGGSSATGVTATVYWSEVVTLLTPDLWHEIGPTPPVDVPVGDTLVVSNALTWVEDAIPGPGHYCFVGLLDHPQDAAPPLPPGAPYFDWDAFRAFVRNHNNVTWRNFNVTDDLPDPGADPLLLPFAVAGAPDGERSFDLEVVRRMPPDVELWWELPRDLAAQLARGRRQRIEPGKDGATVRVLLPPLPRLAFCDIRLGAKLSHPRQVERLLRRGRFVVGGSGEARGGGHQLALRQLYRGEEVGRVTWHFGRSSADKP